MELPTINLPNPLELTLDLTDEQFFNLCHKNQNFKYVTHRGRNQQS